MAAMAYEKRLCILKQLKKGFSADGGLLTGAVYAERSGSELTVTPKIAGLAPLREGRYALAVWVGGARYCLELKGNTPLRVPEAPSLAEGFSVLLCFVRGEAEPVAFGCCGSAPSEYASLLSVFQTAVRREVAPLPEPFRDSAASEPFRAAENNYEPPARSLGQYDDEAIASSDYYEMTGGADSGNGDAAFPESAPQSENVNSDERAIPPFRLSRKGLTYYNQIAAKLKETMARFPRDERLCGIFPQSEWVKTSSGALLGVIYFEGLPRFLCVAMETEPPEEAKEASVFVPLTPYSDEEGMFVVFQDADTGEYVKVENS